MLKIIVESESTQQRYTRLKDSLGSPTDSILLDMLLSCYADSKAIVAKQVKVDELGLGYGGADSSIVHIDLDEQKKSRKTKQ